MSANISRTPAAAILSACYICMRCPVDTCGLMVMVPGNCACCLPNRSSWSAMSPSRGLRVSALRNQILESPLWYYLYAKCGLLCLIPAWTSSGSSSIWVEIFCRDTVVESAVWLRDRERACQETGRALESDSRGGGRRTHHRHALLVLFDLGEIFFLSTCFLRFLVSSDLRSRSLSFSFCADARDLIARPSSLELWPQCPNPRLKAEALSAGEQCARRWRRSCRRWVAMRRARPRCCRCLCAAVLHVGITPLTEQASLAASGGLMTCYLRPVRMSVPRFGSVLTKRLTLWNGTGVRAGRHWLVASDRSLQPAARPWHLLHRRAPGPSQLLLHVCDGPSQLVCSTSRQHDLCRNWSSSVLLLLTQKLFVRDRRHGHGLSLKDTLLRRSAPDPFCSSLDTRTPNPTRPVRSNPTPWTPTPGFRNTHSTLSSPT